MADILDLTSHLTIETEIPPELADAWASGLETVATTKIKSRWDAVAHDAGDWNSNVASPSNVRWAPMLNPDFVSRSGRIAAEINGQQYAKLAAAHANAVAAHDAQFADDAALFKAAVEAKKDNWSRGVGPTLSITGNRHGGRRGPGVLAVLVLTNDPTFQRDLGPGDILVGSTNPDPPFVNPTIRQQFKAALMGILTQGGVFVLKGVMTVDAINARLDTLLTGFLDTTYVAPPDSFVHFESVETGFVLHTHVETA